MGSGVTRESTLGHFGVTLGWGPLSAGPTPPFCGTTTHVFFQCVTIRLRTKKYWAVACFANPGLAFPDTSHPRTLCVPNIRKARIGTFATLVCSCAYWGREPHTATGGNMRDQKAIPTANSWFWHAFSRCVCVLRWLNVFELQVLHSLGYRVATLTIIVTPYLGQATSRGFCQGQQCHLTSQKGQATQVASVARAEKLKWMPIHMTQQWSV